MNTYYIPLDNHNDITSFREKLKNLSLWRKWDMIPLNSTFWLHQELFVYSYISLRWMCIYQQSVLWNIRFSIQLEKTNESTHTATENRWYNWKLLWTLILSFFLLISAFGNISFWHSVDPRGIKIDQRHTTQIKRISKESTQTNDNVTTRKN